MLGVGVCRMYSILIAYTHGDVGCTTYINNFKPKYRNSLMVNDRARRQDEIRQIVSEFASGQEYLWLLDKYYSKASKLSNKLDIERRLVKLNTNHGKICLIVDIAMPKRNYDNYNGYIVMFDLTIW